MSKAAGNGKSKALAELIPHQDPEDRIEVLDADAEALLAALRVVAHGLSRGVISRGVFEGKKDAVELASLVSGLASRGLICKRTVSGTFGTEDRWFAVLRSPFAATPTPIPLEGPDTETTAMANAPRFETTAMGIAAWLDVCGSTPDAVPCPWCEDSMMHPTEVAVNRGGEITTVDHNGTRMAAGSAVGRGVLIAVDFTCECGGRSLLTFHFHKGATYQRVVKVEPEPEPCPATIWRD